MFKKCAQQNSHNVVAAVLNPLRTLLNLVLSVRRCQDERNLRQIRQGFAIKNIRKTFARIFSEYRNIFAVFRNLPPSFSQLHHFYVTRPDRILRSCPIPCHHAGGKLLTLEVYHANETEEGQDPQRSSASVTEETGPVPEPAVAEEGD